MSIFAWIILGLIAGFFSSHMETGVDLEVAIEVGLGAAVLFVAYYITSREKLTE